jgi:hypothetical protein
VLHVAATADPEEQWTIDAAEKGSLVHDVLEQFFSELAADHRPRGGETYTLADLARLGRVAHDRLRTAEDTGDAGHPLVWESTRRELLLICARFWISAGSKTAAVCTIASPVAPWTARLALRSPACLPSMLNGRSAPLPRPSKPS